MTTLLDKTLKREVRIGDRAYIVAISPLALKLTPKGKRKGLELNWEALVSGDAALAVASTRRSVNCRPKPRDAKPLMARVLAQELTAPRRHRHSTESHPRHAEAEP